MESQASFVHVTRAGGTALKRHFNKHLKEHVAVEKANHQTRCTNDNNPIIVVRDVKSRLLSMYRYWLRGSDRYKRSPEWVDANKGVTVKEFVRMIQSDDKRLNNDFTWTQHFEPTTAWIPAGTAYQHIIVIRYDENMDGKLSALLSHLGINDVKLPSIRAVNVTRAGGEGLTELDDPEIVSFMNLYFQNDLALLKLIDRSPELFRLVV